jgi:hypothetical protein
VARAAAVTGTIEDAAERTIVVPGECGSSSRRGRAVAATPAAPHIRAMHPDATSRLARAWLLTAVVDALFSSALAEFVYGTGAPRLWQGVASTLLGPAALDGGTRTVLIGLVMHAGVALAWSTVFLLVHDNVAAVRRVAASRHGVWKVAVAYGPVIWLVMSFVVIPLLTRRPPTITYRWWIQVFGHIPFVAVPIVAMIASRRAVPNVAVAPA